MPTYRKRPVEIQAVRFTGSGESYMRVIEFLGDPHGENHRWMPRTRDGGFIVTLEGEMQFHPGDWIIRGFAGEFYPCRDDIFRATYEPTGEAA